MHALISPTEQAYDYKGEPLGQRVAQVAAAPFEIAPPLFWIACADDVIADAYYYADGAILPVPLPPQPEPVPDAEQKEPTIVE